MTDYVPDEERPGRLKIGKDSPALKRHMKLAVRHLRGSSGLTLDELAKLIWGRKPYLRDVARLSMAVGQLMLDGEIETLWQDRPGGRLEVYRLKEDASF